MVTPGEPAQGLCLSSFHQTLALCHTVHPECARTSLSTGSFSTSSQVMGFVPKTLLFNPTCFPLTRNSHWWLQACQGFFWYFRQHSEKKKKCLAQNSYWVEKQKEGTGEIGSHLQRENHLRNSWSQSASVFSWVQITVSRSSSVWRSPQHPNPFFILTCQFPSTVGVSVKALRVSRELSKFHQNEPKSPFSHSQKFINWSTSWNAPWEWQHRWKGNFHEVRGT